MSEAKEKGAAAAPKADFKPLQKTLLSGVKPTGRPHIGNYFGAMRQFAALPQQKSADGKHLAFDRSIFMIVDYHALNLVQNGPEMRQLILDLALDYLAIGLDPATSIIFKQSDVPAHTELAWIFDTITPMSYLMRAHAFKDAEAKNAEINVGTFNYPMLMAADILLYDTTVVPVGQDQKQHIEYTRDTALKFNNIFGPTFALPDAHIMDTVAIVPGTDGRKMSKSYGNTIPLFAEDDEIVKAVMSIVTDSSSGGIPQHVYNIHALLRPKEELAGIYDAHRGKYKALKEALIEDLKAFITPLRERRKILAADPELAAHMLTDGAEKARAIAEEKMKVVRQRIGVSLTIK